MANASYTPERDRERLTRLMSRRRNIPGRLVRFPDPPARLSPAEREAWGMFRQVLSPLGAVDAGHFAVIESLVFWFVQGERFRERLRGMPAAHPARAALAAVVERSDDSLRLWLRSLWLTRAMLVYISSRCADLWPARIGVPDAAPWRSDA